MAYSDPKNLSTKDRTELLTKLDNYFRSALDHPTWVSWRKNALKCFQYKEGDQWTKEELAILKERKQPPTVNNQISVTIERMVGQFVKQKVRIAYRGRNDPQDKPVAEALSDTLLFIRQNNSLEFEEREMADDGFTAGFGVLETEVTFDDTFQPQIIICHRNPFEIYPDPYSRRYDWNEDANFICDAKWTDLDEAVEKFPAHAKELRQIIGTTSPTLTGDMGSSAAVDAFKKENYVDDKTNRLRLVRCQYKIKEKESICLFGDGTVVNKGKLTLTEPDGTERQITKKQLEDLKASGIKYRELDRIKNKIRVGIFCANVLLEHTEVETRRFSFIPYFVHRKQSGEPYSLVFIALTMQDAINHRESKAIHLLNNNRTFYEKGAVIDKALHASEMSRSDGQVELERGYFDKFKVDEHEDIGQIHFSMHNAAKNDFRQITGINPDAMGEKSEMRSGIGVARKQAMTEIIIAPIFDNLRRTRKILAINVLELIQNNFTERKIFYITDDLGASKAITLNDGQNGEINSVKQGIYDVVVEDLPDTTTMQQEQFDILANMLPQILPFGPFWTKIMFQVSNLRNKDEIVKQIEQMSQPPPTDAKFSVALQWSELTPQEKAAFAIKKLGMPELAAIEMQSGTQPAHITKAQGDQAKEQLKAEGEKQKIQGEMAKTKMEIGKAAMDMTFEREKHQMEMEKKQLEIAQTRAEGAAENGNEGNSDSA